MGRRGGLAPGRADAGAGSVSGDASRRDECHTAAAFTADRRFGFAPAAISSSERAVATDRVASSSRSGSDGVRAAAS
ncbi:hypothetical protein [Rhodoplanes sp. P11]|uniref:hypothetical protein n=1 Tax=Rhodoplanes sp. P11 TaxID=3157621 RepID=UPI003670F28B